MCSAAMWDTDGSVVFNGCGLPRLFVPCWLWFSGGHCGILRPAERIFVCFMLSVVVRPKMLGILVGMTRRPVVDNDSSMFTAGLLVLCLQRCVRLLG